MTNPKVQGYFFYILRCKDNSLYCGQTTNLKKRVAEHNTSQSRASRYVRSRKPAVLVYFEEYNNLSKALAREREIKKWTKKRKEALITT